MRSSASGERRVNFASAAIKARAFGNVSKRRAGGDTHSRASFNTIHKDNDEQRAISLLSRSRAARVTFDSFTRPTHCCARERAVRAALKRRAPPSRSVLSV